MKRFGLDDVNLSGDASLQMGACTHATTLSWFSVIDRKFRTLMFLFNLEGEFQTHSSISGKYNSVNSRFRAANA